MKFVLSLFLIVSASSLLFAQKEVRTYYDPQQKHLQEVYTVSPGDDEKMTGKYLRYYENGNVMVEGNFDEGEKSGVFTEYHENGKPARKLNFVHGLRHGPVEVYNEDGVPVQRAS